MTLVEHPIDLEHLLTLLNEKEVLLKERELALDEQQEEFVSQKEELNAAVEELMAKNNHLTTALAALKQRNEELDQILYRTSHDLKTPVSSIFGLIGILRSSGLNRDQLTILDHFLQKADQMDSMLSSVSELSTVFFHEPQPNHVSIQELLHDVWTALNPGPKFRLEIKLTGTLFVSDVTLLQILFSRVLKNAIDFALPDGSNVVSIDGSISGSNLNIGFSDNGDEIPTDIADRIFDMFYRGSVRSKGPGLGLFIAQRIVRRLHGEIRFINSKPFKTFMICLPQVTV
jgi:signal transduction histidine kinase